MVSEAIQFKVQSSLSKHSVVGCDFIAKLESYLQLSAMFRDFLSQVRDTFQTQHVNFSHLSSSKKVPSSSSTTGTKKTAVSTKNNSAVEANANATPTRYPLEGVALQNTDKIMLGMNSFTLQVSNLLEMVSTLGQFTRLNFEQKLKGLPRFSRLWTLEVFLDSEGEMDESLGQSFNLSDGVSLRAGTVPGDGSISEVTLATPDYLDQLISRTILLQQQQQHQQQQQQLQQQHVAENDGGALHSGGLSMLRKESTATSEPDEQEVEQKAQGVYASIIVM